MTNYKIITSHSILREFIDWLPDLEAGECYYVALFARKKYHESAKHDKSQCKRFTATDKTWLIKKIYQLEITMNRYTNKDGTMVHNDALALYITVNPRSFPLAQKMLLKKLADTLTDCQAIRTNPATMALSCIQKAKSRTIYVDFDLDDTTYEEQKDAILNHINCNAYQILITRGGFHLLVNPSMVDRQYQHVWYKSLSALDACDVCSNNLIPIAGCTQGGFTPYLLEVV